MAHTVSARKRIRQNAKHRARNRWRLTTMRDAVKVVREHTIHGEVEKAEGAFREACKVIDKTAGKGVIHKNTAARLKSRLNKGILAKKRG